MKKASPTLIGVFVLGAIALALGGVIIFGSGKFFEKRTRIIMYFEGSVNGLSVGSPLKFKGVPIGSVAEIRLMVDQEENIVAIPVVAEIDDGKVATDLGTSLHLNDQNINELVQAGLRATLESQSLVTGLLFVGLDIVPDSGAATLHIQSQYPQIPTLPSTFEQFSATLTEVLKQVRQVDFKKLGDGITQTVDGLNKIVNSPEIADTIEELDQTLVAMRQAIEEINNAVGPVTQNFEDATKEATKVFDTLRQTIETAQALIQPDAPLAYELEQTIKDVGGAARALKQLADLVDEQPTVLLYGKEGERE
ncbi:MAG: MlaD family protein [Candidatus Binatia bacterium]|nr:MlaD family protein [Candidatus Binatia bacterium]